MLDRCSITRFPNLEGLGVTEHRAYSLRSSAKSGSSRCLKIQLELLGLMVKNPEPLEHLDRPQLPVFGVSHVFLMCFSCVYHVFIIFWLNWHFLFK